MVYLTIAAVCPIEPYTPGGPILERDWSEVIPHPGDEVEHRALALWVKKHDPELLESNLEDQRPPWTMIVRVRDDAGNPQDFLARGYLPDDVVVPDFVVTQDLGDDNAAWLRIAAGKSEPAEAT